MSLNLGLPDVLLLDWGYAPLARTPQEWVAVQCIILGGDGVNMSYTSDVIFIILSGIFHVFPV